MLTVFLYQLMAGIQPGSEKKLISDYLRLCYCSNAKNEPPFTKKLLYKKLKLYFKTKCIYLKLQCLRICILLNFHTEQKINKQKIPINYKNKVSFLQQVL